MADVVVVVTVVSQSTFAASFAQVVEQSKGRRRKQWLRRTNKGEGYWTKQRA